MKLVKCPIKFKASTHKKLQEILGPTYTSKRFHLQAYQRDYDVFLLTGHRGSVVVKSTKDINEVHAYGILETSSIESTPQVYFIDKDQDNYLIVMAYVQAKDQEWTLETIKDLAIRLGKVHTCVAMVEPAVGKLRKWHPDSHEDLYALMDSEITRAHVDMICRSHEILSGAYKTLIHGDMIPLNVVDSPDGVKIIDWEHCGIGPYILDMGRLLGDYNVDKAWVNPDWEREALKAYYHCLCKRGMSLSYDQMYIDYQCARLHNYLGVVHAFKSRERERDAWYDLNLKEMIKTIGCLEELLHE